LVLALEGMGGTNFKHIGWRSSVLDLESGGDEFEEIPWFEENKLLFLSELFFVIHEIP